MASWEKVTIVNQNGVSCEASAPVIISASRSTDIPAFYSKWFFNRLASGYCTWTNPFNRVKSYISFSRCKAIVFWTKNPAPFMPYLDVLEKLDMPFYLLYTLNDYNAEGLERWVLPLEERLDTFIALAKRTGAGKVIWRFDPIILTDTITPDVIISKIAYIAGRLEEVCDRMIFSFLDIREYPKAARTMRAAGIECKIASEAKKWDIAGKLSEIGTKHGIQVRTCCEPGGLELFGILPSRCIDGDLFLSLYPDHRELSDYILARKGKKDPGQRSGCLCFPAKDIGRYSTCPHGCIYCYANTGLKAAGNYFRLHDPDGEGL